MSKNLRPKQQMSKTAAPKNSDSFLANFNIDSLIPNKYQTLAAIGILLVLFAIFFSPLLFGNKTFYSGDILTGHSYETVKEKYDGGTLWNPYIFCGLPSQFSGVGYSRWFDFINTGYAEVRIVVGNIFGNDYVQHLVFLFTMALTSYFFMRNKKASMLISLIVSVATVFSTGIVVFIFIGHITKLYSLAMFPLILMIMLRFQDKIKLLDFALLTVAFTFLVSGWHVQVIFYIFFALLIYFLYYGIRALVTKEFVMIKKLLLSGLAIVAAGVIAMGISYDIYAQMFEYTEYSTRGTKSIAEVTAGHADESMYYQYSTQYSFSPEEVSTFIFPSAFGYGNSIDNSKLGGTDGKANTYFGQMEMVDVPMYMGVVVFVFGLLGIVINRKDSFVQYLAIVFVVSLFISFGKNFSVVYDLMFHYFPYFDKFRVPSMILTLIQMTMPILAGYALMKIISLKENPDPLVNNILKYSAIGFSVLTVLAVVLSNTLAEGFVSRMAAAERFAGQNSTSRLFTLTASMFTTDVILAMVFLAIAFWLAFAYSKGSLSRDIFAIGVLVIITIDLFRISGRGAEYHPVKNIENVFEKPQYVSTIENQKDKDPFRIFSFRLDAQGSPLPGTMGSSNYNMYFLLQDLYGYSGIKPRSFQDFDDVLTSKNIRGFNPTFWNMLNVKYFVFSAPLEKNSLMQYGIELPNLKVIDSTAGNVVHENLDAMPRAYFVNSVEKKTGMEFLNLVKQNKFNPKEIGYSEVDLKVDRPDSTASVKMLKYDNDVIEIEANATGNNLLFVGDTYYPKGWIATIDGNETQIYRINHGFRGVVVPAGKHIVKMEYKPTSYYTGKTLSLALNVLVILGFAFGIFLNRKEKNKPVGEPAE